ncbi:MAG: 1-phosphatidylinositol phosphodiesterase [Arcobacteraceae bacterium]|jgi:1-phosphatidylinositol phosphodiesterase
MKIIKIIIAILVTNLMFTNLFASQNHYNWMKNINDITNIRDIAIPGTHDSGANRGFESLGRTQTWSIETQLKKGIRFLDIRLGKPRWYKNYSFEVMHGPIRYGNFDTKVMSHVIKFLQQHPTETIFMSIKDEDGTLVDHNLDDEYIYANNSIFYTEAHKWTKLNEVRGKIVLVNRYSRHGGLQWSDNSIFKVQDKYDLHKLHWWYSRALSKKTNAVKKHLKKAKKTNDDKFYINFASAHYYGGQKKRTSKKVNRSIKKYFNKYNKRNKSIKGIVIMDYPNLTNGVISKIIENNK